MVEGSSSQQANAAKHSTVLLKEAVDGLAIDADGLYIDGTFGRGGHVLNFKACFKRILQSILRFVTDPFEGCFEVSNMSISDIIFYETSNQEGWGAQ